MNAVQESTLQRLNDRWGAAKWTEKPDGTLDVELDDGGVTTIFANGYCPLLSR